MKYIIKIISITLILTLADNLAGQNTTNTTTLVNITIANTTSPTNTTIPANTTTPTNTTIPANTTTPTNTTDIPVITPIVTPIIHPGTPVIVESNPLKLYLCDEKYSNNITIVSFFYLYIIFSFNTSIFITLFFFINDIF